MGVKIKHRKIDDLLVYEIHGKIASEDAIKISKTLEGSVKKPGEKIVIDLSRIDYLDSHWLGVFVYTWKILQDNKKELLFVIPPGFVLDLFRNSNLDKTFRIVPTLDTLTHSS